jgi:hypothetical protein
MTFDLVIKFDTEEQRSLFETAWLDGGIEDYYMNMMDDMDCGERAANVFEYYPDEHFLLAKWIED